MKKARRLQRIPPYEIGDGSEIADRALTGVGKMFGGYVPNIHKVMANSPAMIEAFEAMRRLLQNTKLSAAEREIISIEVSRRSDCDYCKTAHSHFARRLRVSEQDVSAALTGRPMAEPRLALVQQATQRLLDRRGKLTDDELLEFHERGLSDAELLEIVAIIGWYVMSTYTNNLAQTEIDDFFKD